MTDNMIQCENCGSYEFEDEKEDVCVDCGEAWE